MGWIGGMARSRRACGLMAVLSLAGPFAGAVAGQQPGDDLGRVESQQATFDLQVVATGFQVPYALAFLPDGRLLITDRTAMSLTLVDVADGGQAAITGLPPIYFHDGGGLSDLILHPAYATNGWIYFDYALETAEGITLAVSRARLDGTRLVDHERLLVIDPAVPDNTDHLGSRLAIRDGYLFVTMGERYSLREQAQDNGTHSGTVLRVHDDGRIPVDNPFVDVPGALPEIWSFGHRNAQGLAFHPETGELWLDEHGPQGGDELNRVRRGANYGWPVITYGTEYDSEGGGPIGEGITRHEGMEQPVYYYRPSIGPSDLLFYDGAAFPEWRGDAFIAAMALRHLNRLEMFEGRVLSEERLLEDRGWRIRSVEQAPDGSLYLGVDADRDENRTVRRPGMVVRLSRAAN